MRRTNTCHIIMIITTKPTEPLTYSPQDSHTLSVLCCLSESMLDSMTEAEFCKCYQHSPHCMLTTCLYQASALLQEILLVPMRVYFVQKRLGADVL